MKIPIINERVKRFLSETIRQIEFSHTILHNKVTFIYYKLLYLDFQFINYIFKKFGQNKLLKNL